MQTREPELVSFEIDRAPKIPLKGKQPSPTGARTTTSRLTTTTARQQYDYGSYDSEISEHNEHFIDDNEIVIKTKPAAPRTLITLTDASKTTVSSTSSTSTKKSTSVKTTSATKTTRAKTATTTAIMTTEAVKNASLSERNKNDTTFYEIVPIFRLSKFNPNKESSSANSSTKYERIYWPWLGKFLHIFYCCLCNNDFELERNSLNRLILNIS
jgi:hypothetical protein